MENRFKSTIGIASVAVLFGLLFVFRDAVFNKLVLEQIVGFATSVVS